MMRPDDVDQGIRPGHRVLCVAECLERFAVAGSRAQRVDSRKNSFAVIRG
jgi:hypothetical protein